MNYFHKDNPQLQAAIDGYFATLAAYNDTHFDGCLSILLLGSLSRGEATWIETPTGPVMVSDIEFFVVHPKGFDRFAEFDKVMEEAAKANFAEGKTSLFHIDTGYVCKERLSSLERKLLTYDATQMGKTVMGEDVIPLLPPITLENINLMDIKDILTHRTFSVLYYGLPLKEAGETEQYRYSLAKNSLDLMTVLLVTHGQLVSGFANRLERVKQLPIDENIKQYFAYCLSLKLKTVCDANYSIEEMEALFLQIVKDLQSHFRVPLKNSIVNAKFVTRRILGMVKRAIKHRHIPAPGHLQRLIHQLEQQQPLSEKNLRDNLVINGYPLV